MNSNLQTKKDVAKAYSVQPRTVSNWLQRARVKEGESFPGHFIGSAIAFTPEQVETLLQYAGIDNSKPDSRVSFPDPPDTHESVAVIDAEIVPATGFVPIEVTTVTITRRYQDTTAIDASTERAQNITGDLWRQFNEAFVADTAGEIQAMRARRDQAIAAIEANGVAKAIQEIS